MPPRKKVDPVFAWESISQAMEDGLEDLIALHDSEVGYPDQPPLEVNWLACLAAERAGSYRSVSARLAGKLIGYRSFFVEPSINHKSVLFAINHALFIDPFHRKTMAGPKLIRVSDRMLKEAGVKIVLQADRSVANLARKPGSATLSDLLRRQGYGAMETVLAKRL